MGYDYSIYIDGDTYCSGQFQWDHNQSFGIAGTAKDTIRQFFIELGDFDKITNCFKLNDLSGFDQPRIQSGVLVYNNSQLKQINYFAKARNLFDRSIKAGIPRKGDDSLLAFMIAMYSDLKTISLPQYYNFIDFIDYVQGQHAKDDFDTELITKCIIYHFINQKPWHLTDYFPNYPHKYFSGKWIEIMINNFTQEEIKSFFPAWYKAEIVDSSKVKFYWFKGQINFGDWITPYFIKKICNHDAIFADPHETDEAVIISTGSIMRLCGSNTVVWGSGIRDRNQEIKHGKLIRSTRGPITRTRILEIEGECPPIYGDPALLLPKLYNPGIQFKKFKLGITPHISQFERVYELYKDEKEVNVIDLRTNNIEAVINKFLECEAIASSSLHGIIVANAYNIPVRWIQFDTNIYGDNTKFYDHFSSIGRPLESFIDSLIYFKLPVEDILNQIIPYSIEIDLEKLWNEGIFYKSEISKYIRYVLSS
jgi:hypothetical protein